MEGHIAKKNGRYYPVISIKDPGTGKWKRKWLPGHKTKREAEKAKAEAINQVNNGWLPTPSKETIAQLFQNYFDNVAPNHNRMVTLQSYKSIIDTHLIPKFGAKPAVALTPDDLEFMMTTMGKEGKSATTIRYTLRIIHRVLRDAVRKGKLSRNVADLVDPPSETTPERKTWDEAEFDRFLTAAADSEYYEYFSTLALTGARRGEVLGLKWSDLDLEVIE